MIDDLHASYNMQGLQIIIALERFESPVRTIHREAERMYIM